MDLTPARRARIEQSLNARLGSVVAVCEALRRRHNVSAILRSCEAFGIHEVHLITGRADGGGFAPSPSAARGAERWVERRVFPDVAASAAELRARGFRLLIADWQEDAYTPETVPVDQPVAVLFGSELRGVSADARAVADGVVAVPMRGLTTSLNVSVSAALILRGVAERRRAYAGADLDTERQAAFFASWLAAEEAERLGRRARTDPAEEAELDGEGGG